ncbi:MAG: DUF2169 domain-containing protein [Minicystis sp.]
MPIPGGEIGAALVRAGNDARCELVARLDLAAPGPESALCRLAHHAAEGAAWDGVVPAAGRARLIGRGRKAARIVVVARGREVADVELTPGDGERVEREAPPIAGDERLLITEQQAPIVWQLPGMAPRASATFADGSMRAFELAGVAIDVDLVRKRVSLFWRGVMEAAGAATLDDIAISATFIPAASIAQIATELDPPLPPPGCATPIDNDGGLVAFTFPRRLRAERDARVVVVKGTFDLVPDDRARPAAEQDAPSGEERPAGGGSASYPGDFVPHKPRADVLLKGYAHAKPGAATTLVELSVGSLSVKVAVIGPRRWLADGRPSEPGPIDTVALRWEHAFGGPDFPANPVGVGVAPDVRVPQLERPGELIRTRADRPRPAGFSAIPSDWAARAARVGSYGADWLASRWPHFPEDFDWGYFNAAPPELVVEELRGDEEYRITSVLPGGGDLRGKLPGTRPRCFAEHASGAITEVPLRIDTAVFDADRRKVVLVWRGAIELSEGPSLRRFLVTDEAIGAPRSMEAIRRRMAARRGPESTEPPAAPALMREIRDQLAERRPLPGAARAPSPAAPRPAAPRVSRRQVERWLADGEPLAGRDLSGADLSGLDFSGRELSGTLLRGAILDDARLDGARCEGLFAVDLRARRSSWKGARLTRANLARADLTGADLEGAILDQATLADAELEGIVAVRAQGTAVQLARSRLRRASFTGAKLDHADLSGATLDGARFDGAVLDDAKLYEVLGEGVLADGASLADARFESARLERASFRGARARGSMWESAELGGADFTGADLAGAGFTGAGLSRARFTGADLSGARLRLATLAGASFAGADSDARRSRRRCGGRRRLLGREPLPGRDRPGEARGREAHGRVREGDEARGLRFAHCFSHQASTNFRYSTTNARPLPPSPGDANDAISGWNCVV